jgi:preprotein translocase subunit SecE
MKKILVFLSEVKSELERVTWPKRETVINYLGLVIVFSIIVASFVGVLDFGLTKSLEYFVAR